MSVSRTVVSRPVLFTIIFVILSGLGLFFYSELPVEMIPDIEFPMISVITTYEGAAPESVEKTVTKLIEENLTSVTGVKELTSTSSEGRSVVMLEFEFGTNLDTAANDVRDKLDRVRRRLPDDADVPLIRQFDSTSIPIMHILVRGDRDLGELRYFCENTLEDLISQVDGVGEVQTNGGKPKAVQVELYQNRLEAYGITISDIDRVLDSQNMELGGGDIDSGTREYLIRTTGEFRDVEEIGRTVIANKNGYDVKLSDLGNVFMGYKDLRSIASVNGVPGVYLSIRRSTGANIVQVADRLHKKLEEIKSYIPEDISLLVIRDDSKEIRNVLNELKTTLWQGLILVVIVLYIFLRSFKSTLIISISLPVAILITVFSMFMCGFTLNMMSLTGLILGLGMILDASIVVLENVYQHLDYGETNRDAVINGTSEMISAITSSTLTTVVVFLPFIFYRNQLEVLGQMMSDVIFTIIISVSVSLFVAVFLVPVLATKYLPVKAKMLKAADGGTTRKRSFVDAIRDKYRNGIKWSIRHRIIVLLIVMLLFGGGLLMLSKTRMIFMPGMTSSNVTLSVTLAPGTRLEETEKFMMNLEELVKKEVPEYKYIITTSGNYTGIAYQGEVSIELLDVNERTITQDDVKDRLRKYFTQFPQAKFEFSTGRRGGASTTPTIKLQLTYDNINGVRDTANDIIAMINDRMQGSVVNAVLDLTDGLPQVEVVIDRQRAYNFGLSVSAIANEVRNAVEGVESTTYREEGNEYDVVVRLREEDRMQIPDLNKIFLISDSGEKVYLSNVADLKKGVGPMTISRDNKRRMATVKVECSATAKLGDVQNGIKDLIDSNIILPSDVTYSFDGDWVDAQEKGKYVFIILIMAVILIFAVMAGQYESFKNPFINMFTIPLLVIGVAAIYFFTGSSLSMFSGIGAVMLTGIVVNNGIVLVDFTNQLRARGMGVYEACVEAAVTRIRPIMMTSLTTIFAMLPMAFSHKEGPNMTQPIALTVLGGLCSATFITLFFIPVMYYIFNETRENKRKLKMQGK